VVERLAWRAEARRRLKPALLPHQSRWWCKIPRRMAGTSRIPTTFISSTAEDLQPYRAAARDGFGKARFLPEMQEYWVARDNGTTRRLTSASSALREPMSW